MPLPAFEGRRRAGAPRRAPDDHGGTWHPPPVGAQPEQAPMMLLLSSHAQPGLVLGHDRHRAQLLGIGLGNGLDRIIHHAVELLPAAFEFLVGRGIARFTAGPFGPAHAAAGLKRAVGLMPPPASSAPSMRI